MNYASVSNSSVNLPDKVSDNNMPLLSLFFLARYGYTLKNLELLSDTLINRGWRGFPCSVLVICLNLEILVNKSIQA
jgi:hypothetical protein